MTRQPERARLRAGWVSLIAATVIFGGKLAAYYLTDSTAVLSDAMESVVNIAAAAMLVLALVVAARPADRDHPYGHGKVEYFSAGIEAAFIFGAALLICVEAVRALWVGSAVHDLGVGLAVLGAFGVANVGLGVYLLRVGQRTQSYALIADAKHVLADVWTTGGVIAGLIAVQVTGWAMLDPLIALAVALHILRAGWQLGRGAIDGLMDAAHEGDLAAISACLEKARGAEWIDVHGVRSWRSGAVLHTDMHVVVPRYLDAQRLHEIHDEIEDAVAEATGLSSDVVAHFDPCRPHQCVACEMADCGVRDAEFVARPTLTVDRIRRTDAEAEADVAKPT